MDMIWIVVFLIVCVNSESHHVLLRTTPGGDGVQPAGIWAGKLKISDNGQADDLYENGFSELEDVENPTESGLDVLALSTDPVGKDLLVVTKSKQGYPTLTIGGLCENSKKVVLLHNIQLHAADHPYIADTECGYKCGWGPIALFNGRVYFVLTAVYGRIFTQLTREIHIRVLNTTGNCADIIDKLGPREDTKIEDFPVLECSSLVTTLLIEPYVKPNPRPTLWPSQHLAVGEFEGKLYFYLQLMDTRSGESQLTLVRSSESEQMMHELSTQPLHSVFTGNQHVRALGSVDYRHGVLCWTTGDRLLCSSHVPGSDQVSPVEIIAHGEAQAKGICIGGSIPDEGLRNAVTGVSIAETRDQLAVYFGCYSELPGTGGVGLVTVQKHGLIKAVYSVTSNKRKVYGSHVVVMKWPVCSSDGNSQVADQSTVKSTCTCETNINNAHVFKGDFAAVVVSLIIVLKFNL